MIREICELNFIILKLGSEISVSDEDEDMPKRTQEIKKNYVSVNHVLFNSLH